MPVVFHQTFPVLLKNRKRLKLFLFDLFQNEGKCLEGLNIIFCSDEDLLAINQQYLKHNFFTDIITFDLSESSVSPLTAELYISIERVRDNSTSLKTSFIAELHRVVFHGALHLCGFKDKKTADKKLMRQKEDEYLLQYFAN